MDALSIFFTVSSIVTIAIAAFGAIKMNRRNLLLGTFLYSLLLGAIYNGTLILLLHYSINRTQFY